MEDDQSGHTGLFGAFRVHNFRLLIVGTTLANAAHWVQHVSLGWLVYDLTGSGTALDLFSLVRSIATVGLAPLSGVIIDRVPRRRLMLALNLWLLLASLVLGVVLLTGHQEVWYLFVFTFLTGLAAAVDQPLRQTVVFTLLPRSLAANAIALIQTGWGLMRSIGPAFGGAVMLLLGPGGNFVFMAIAYGLIGLNTVRLRFPREPVAETSASLRDNLGEGVRYLIGNPLTRTFVLLGWLQPLLVVPNFIALPPIYVSRVFGGGPETLGLLLSSVGVGGIAGGLVTASLGSVDRRGAVQLGALAMLGLALLGVSLSPTLLVAVLCFAAAGFFEIVVMTSNQTLLQLSIPGPLRGRVTGLTALSAGLSPVGAMVAGIGSDLVGPQLVTLALSSGVVCSAILVYWRVPLVRNHSMIDAQAGEPDLPRM